MSPGLALSDRTRRRAVNLRHLRKLLGALLEMLPRPLSGELGITIVDVAEITRINETFLHHAGPTDVISFGYAEPGDDSGLTGEVLVCLAEACRQARRYGVAWQSELLRYVIHGCLHLCDYDDQTPAERSRMKQEEERLLHALETQLSVNELAARIARQGVRSNKTNPSLHNRSKSKTRRSSRKG